MADRTFWPTALAGLGSAALAAVSAARPWADTPNATAVAAGSAVAPVALALSLVALAAWGAVLVTRRLARSVIAAVGLLASLGTLAAVLVSRGDAVEEANLALSGIRQGAATTTGWYYVAAATSAVAAATFAVALLKARGWPEMGAKYDAPGTIEREQTDLWKAMDEGHDPTV